jgi:hypothetical protein
MIDKSDAAVDQLKELFETAKEAKEAADSDRFMRGLRLKSRVEDAVMRSSWNNPDNEYPKSQKEFSVVWDQGRDSVAFKAIYDQVIKFFPGVEYPIDVFIDLLAITRWYPGESFFWGVSYMGTYYTRENKNLWSNENLLYIRGVRRNYPDVQLFVWNQEKQELSPLDPDKFS